MSDEKTITSMSQENRKIEPSPAFRDKAYVKSEDEYKKIYAESIENPEKIGIAVEIAKYHKLPENR